MILQHVFHYACTCVACLFYPKAKWGTSGTSQMNSSSSLSPSSSPSSSKIAWLTLDQKSFLLMTKLCNFVQTPIHFIHHRLSFFVFSWIPSCFNKCHRDLKTPIQCLLFIEAHPLWSLKVSSSSSHIVVLANFIMVLETSRELLWISKYGLLSIWIPCDYGNLM